MNKMKLFIGLCSLILWSGIAFAEGNQTADPDGNFALSQIGVVKVTTGTIPKYQTRKIRTTNDGQLLVFQGVSQSSFSNSVSVDTGTIMDKVYRATYTVSGTTGAVHNPNVLMIGSQQKPIYLGKLVMSTGWGTTVPERYEVFDTRGSTQTNKVFDLTFHASGTVTTVNFEHWLSSGLTIKKYGSNSATITWEQFDWEQSFFP